MERFFFHLKTPSAMQRDETGIELGSMEEARAEAVNAIPGLAADLLRVGTDPMNCELIIVPQSGKGQAVVRFLDLVKGRQR
jgi:hypothetical protein